MHAALLVLTMFGATSNEYTVNQNLWDVVLGKSPRDLNTDVLQVLPNLQAALPATVLEVYAIPTGSRRYYRLKVSGRYRRFSVVYQVELWPQGNSTRVRSYIDLSHPCRIVQRFLPAAERAILARSQQVWNVLSSNSSTGVGGDYTTRTSKCR